MRSLTCCILFLSVVCRVSSAFRMRGTTGAAKSKPPYTSVFPSFPHEMTKLNSAGEELISNVPSSSKGLILSTNSFIYVSYNI